MSTYASILAGSPYIQYYVVLGSDVEHSDYTILYFAKRSSPRYFKYPPGTIHSHYNHIDYISYAVLYSIVDVLYIPVTTL